MRAFLRNLARWVAEAAMIDWGDLAEPSGLTWSTVYHRPERI